MNKQGPGVILDYEAADRITVANLLDYKENLENDLKRHSEGGWLHPEDVVHNQKMIEAINIVVKDFGG